MTFRIPAIVAGVLVACFQVLACGGGTPTTPSPTCVPVVGATSMSLYTGDVFRVRFTVPAVSKSDVLMTFAGEDVVTWRQGAAIQRLYDGATLLGSTDESFQDSVTVWKSPSSGFGTPASPYGISSSFVVVDFGSIARGAIDGRFEFAVTRGTLFMERMDLATVVMLLPFTGNEPWIYGTVSSRELCR